MTQAHLDLQSQLDSQNISNISDPSSTPLCNNSPISFLSLIEPTNHQIEEMDTTHKSSDTDNNETLSQNHKPSEQSPSTPHLHPILLLMYIHHSSLQKTHFQHKEMIISYQFYRTKLSHSNLN